MPTPRLVGERRRIDPLELALLAMFGLVSVWVLGLDLWGVIVHGRVWTGTDGVFIVDQMQYLAWIRDAANHGLASDLFVLTPTAHDYLQPVVEISAGLTALGIAPWLSLLIWKPVAVIAAFFAIRAYCHRLLSARYARVAALALALFFGSYGVLGDEWLPFWSWGYPFGLMAIAALIGALLVYSRARERRGGGWAAPLLGLIAAWVHPWQGETLILIILAGEAVDWCASFGRSGPQRPRPRFALLAVTVVATALPLAYYWILDRLDPIWRLGQAANDQSWPVGGILLSLAPLLLVAALAYRRRPRSYLGATTMVWPFACLAVYALSEIGLGATPLHSFAGITIPLAILAVGAVEQINWRRLPRRRLAGALIVAAATIPGSAVMLGSAYGHTGPSTSDPNFMNHDEQRALAFLAHDPQPGGVLSDFYMGMVVPSATGRNTYIGDYLWSIPGYKQRFGLTFDLFQWAWRAPSPGAFRRLSRVDIRIVLSTHARFVLSDCHTRTDDLVGALRPISSSIHRFGCATVFQIVGQRAGEAALRRLMPRPHRHKHRVRRAAQLRR